jgi:hypothetical protein
LNEHIVHIEGLQQRQNLFKRTLQKNTTTKRESIQFLKTLSLLLIKARLSTASLLQNRYLYSYSPAAAVNSVPAVADSVQYKYSLKRVTLSQDTKLAAKAAPVVASAAAPVTGCH